jgi:chemotaxis signal transduction protein
LLHIDRPTTDDPRAPARLVVIQKGDVSWVFRADEVLGVQRFATGDLGPIPVTVAHSVARVSKGLLTLGERRIGYLDSEALFALLRRAVG